MTAHPDCRPSWSSRLLSAGAYLGLAPLFWSLHRCRADAYFSHHARQAVAGQWLLFGAILAPFPFLFLATYVFTYHEDWDSYQWLGRIGLVLLAASLSALVWLPLRKTVVIAFLGMLIGGVLASIGLPSEMTGFLIGLSLWGLLSLIGVALALSGSTWPIPVVSRLAHSPWLTRLAFIANSGLLLVVTLFAAITIHANLLARDDVAPAPVYFLFENRDHPALGTWGPKMIFYRVSRVAQERWGSGSVVVAPILQDNIRMAIRHGRFVVLISHGKDGLIATSDPPAPGTFRAIPPNFSASGLRPARICNTSISRPAMADSEQPNGNKSLLQPRL